MFALGISRGQPTQTIFTTAIALALAAVPMAMPTVLQVILSTGSTTLASQGAVVKSLASVETLGSTSAINSDKTGTLTMNQVTVTEVIDPTDPYSITGMGYGLDGEVEHAAGKTNTIEDAILPFLVANDAKLVDGKVVFYRIRDGRIVEFRGSFDMLSMFQQLGVATGPEPRCRRAASDLRECCLAVASAHRR